MAEVAAAEGIDLAASYAYSDSYTDAPMLEAVGHPVAVNPDRVLLKLAREKGWEVRTFAKPVRLRDRVPVPSRRATIGAGSGAIAAAVTAVVVWWLRYRSPPPPPSLLQQVRRRAASWLPWRRG
jgi:hypothetical protein